LSEALNYRLKNDSDNGRGHLLWWESLKIVAEGSKHAKEYSMPLDHLF